MKKENLKNLCWALGLLASFTLWTWLVSIVDIAKIGPHGSSVGFSRINSWVHSLTGVHMWLYDVTDWLGLVPVAVGFGFAVFGLVQWIRRRNILKVDFSILALGVFYIITLSAYLFFEEFPINYRPVLIMGYLEASYPSSTTLLVLCVMSTALMQFKWRIKNKTARRIIFTAIVIFIVFIVFGRLISGVHWLTDIIGSILLSIGLVMLYKFVCTFK